MAQHHDADAERRILEIGEARNRAQQSLHQAAAAEERARDEKGKLAVAGLLTQPGDQGDVELGFPVERSSNAVEVHEYDLQADAGGDETPVVGGLVRRVDLPGDDGT